MQRHCLRRTWLIFCLVLGDSIALGVGQTLPECRTEARVGVTSRQFVHHLSSPLHANNVVISLGVNDGNSPTTVPNLRRLRESVHSRTVFWLLPAHREHTRAAIRTVAAQFGDRLIDCSPQTGPDGLHPTGIGYRTLGAQIRWTTQHAG